MAHFAELDQNNQVINVIRVNDEDILDENGNESEEIGIAFCKNVLGQNTCWKQTSYNNNIRYNYACIGSKYDADADAFILPKPYNSWILNTSTYNWDPPVPLPDNVSEGFCYKWNEETISWDFEGKIDVGISTT